MIRKKAQSQVITTVLLILLSIAAVTLVAKVVIDFIQERLLFTNCDETYDSLEINLNEGYTYFNRTSNITYVSISRGAEESFDLVGLIIAISMGDETKPYELIAGEKTTGVKMYDDTQDIVMPSAPGRKTYKFSDTKEVKKVEVAGIILAKGKNIQCKITDSKEIPVLS